MARRSFPASGVLPPRKRFGQHFLEPSWVDKVIRAIDPRPAEVFVEIGPGRGALTFPLAGRAKAIVACEIDRDLADRLRADAPPNVTVVTGDFLDHPWLDVDRPPGPLRLAGNLPYNAATPILFRLTELYARGAPFTDATLMLQREVAARLAAAPGTRDYGVMTVLIGRVARVQPLLMLPPGAFRPVPRVDSALVRLRFHPPDVPARDDQMLTALVRAIFTRRRKTVANALLAFAAASRLSPALALERAGIDPRRRPETLTGTELVRLSDAFARAVL
jgi:16S rRNA (adenine1518-N6/adenine1519-N6)-dimethyltransferase